MHESTITNSLVGPGPGEAQPPEARPQLVLIAVADDPHAPSARHLLDDIDEVRFGRGERSTRRVVDDDGCRVLELRIPDRRMSSDHGRLVRRAPGWLLDDPASKNGAIVDGVVTRWMTVGDGALVELGHTFFVFRAAAVEREAPADLRDRERAAGGSVLDTFDGALIERYRMLVRIAPAEVSVLLQGETGTGKELVAHALHERSGRTGAFIAVNCGALPASLIEAELFGHRRGAFTGAVTERLGLVRSAHGGTLFLDEVGELPIASQAAFLRVLQEREVVPIGVDHAVKVDVRLCAATLRDLESLVESGQFRRDLYARLFGLTIELPPLRDRRCDLGILIRRLLAELPGGAQVRLAPAALRALLRYGWPLNIRELDKVLATAVALATSGGTDPVIDLEHLPDAIRRAGPGAPISPAPAAVSPGGAASAPPAAPDARPGAADPADAAGIVIGSSGAGTASPPQSAAGEPGARTADDELRDQLVGLLTLHRGNVRAVSHVLGVRRTQVYRWLRRLSLDVAAFRQ